MTVTGEKVQEAVGALQLCGGQPAGVEAAIHAMRKFLEDDACDRILLERNNASTELIERQHYGTYSAY